MIYEKLTNKFMSETEHYRQLSMSQLREKMAMTAERAQRIESAEFIYEKLIPKGLITVIAAPPNGGKTTIAMHIAAVIASKHFQVFYIDFDSSGIHIGEYFKLTHPANIEYWTEIGSDLDAQALLTQLVHVSKNEADQSDCVYIFDTLKKFTNLMNKAKVAEFMGKVRSLTRNGATVLLLAHTNKRPEVDGSYLFEGVGDVKNDCDNLFYLLPTKNDDGSLTVTVDLGDSSKKKALLEPCTFIIQPDRTVNLSEQYADPESVRSYEYDKSDIETILNILQDETLNESMLIDLAQQQGISRRQCRRILRSYDYWRVTKGDKNATLYSKPE